MESGSIIPLIAKGLKLTRNISHPSLVVKIPWRIIIQKAAVVQRLIVQLNRMYKMLVQIVPAKNKINI